MHFSNKNNCSSSVRFAIIIIELLKNSIYIELVLNIVSKSEPRCIELNVFYKKDKWVFIYMHTAIIFSLDEWYQMIHFTEYFCCTFICFINKSSNI